MAVFNRKTLKAAEGAWQKRIKERMYTRDEKGRIIVPVTIRDDENFLSSYTKSDIPIINSDISNYLDSLIEFLPPAEILHFQIRSNCINPEEQKIYKEAIKEYFLTQYSKSRRQFKRNLRMGVITSLIGALLILITYLIAPGESGTIIQKATTEAVNIAAWVFFWEALDILLMQNYECRRNRKIYATALMSKIEFIEKEEPIKKEN
jgi:hypothetical protein